MQRMGGGLFSTFPKASVKYFKIVPQVRDRREKKMEWVIAWKKTVKRGFVFACLWPL